MKWKDKLIAYQCYTLCKRLKIYIINDDGTIKKSFEIEKEDRSVGPALGLNTQPIVVDETGYIYLAYNQIRDENTEKYVFRTVHLQKYSQDGELLWTQESYLDNPIGAIKDLLHSPSGCIAISYKAAENNNHIHKFNSTDKPSKSYSVLNDNPVPLLGGKYEREIALKNVYFNNDNLIHVSAKNNNMIRKGNPVLIKYNLDKKIQTKYILDKNTFSFTSTMDNEGNLIASIHSMEKLKKAGSKKKVKYHSGYLYVFTPAGEVGSKYVFYEDQNRPYGLGIPILAKNGLLLRWGAAEKKLYLTDYKNEILYDEKEVTSLFHIKHFLSLTHPHEDGIFMRISEKYFLFIEIVEK